nr:uncharacterized protein LOC104099485 [Nicotiana tomentosiformis]
MSFIWEKRHIFKKIKNRGIYATNWFRTQDHNRSDFFFNALPDPRSPKTKTFLFFLLLLSSSSSLPLVLLYHTPHYSGSAAASRHFFSGIFFVEEDYHKKVKEWQQTQPPSTQPTPDDMASLWTETARGVNSRPTSHPNSLLPNSFYSQNQEQMEDMRERKL